MFFLIFEAIKKLVQNNFEENEFEKFRIEQDKKYWILILKIKIHKKIVFDKLKKSVYNIV